MAFAYEDICKDIFASVCKQEEIPFVPSRIGSYWLNDYDSNTEIDIMAKYSLQGTTQGRYLTGGVPPVRFSM